MSETKLRELLERSLKLNKELFELVAKVPYERALEIAKIEKALANLSSEPAPAGEALKEKPQPQPPNEPEPEKPRRRF